MDAFLKMDIFFVIASAAAVSLSILLGAVLWYALRIARTLDRIATDIAGEAHAIKGDLDDARLAAKREGRALMGAVDKARKAVGRLASDTSSRT